MIRAFAFDVRPHHRETLDSYSRRILAANFCTAEHQKTLIKAATNSNNPRTHTETWKELLVAMNRRDKLHLDRMPAAGLTHADGTSCDHCATLLTPRWACTFCSHGEQILQNPHFDNIVCTRHKRWIGLTDAPTAQHPIGEAAVAAQHRLTRLIRNHRIDVHRYILIDNLVNHTAEARPRTPEQLFIAVVALLDALSTTAFMRDFFNTAHSFADSFTHLNALVTGVLQTPSPSTVRGIWLYLRPTVASLRHAVAQGTEYQPSWAHDYILNAKVALERTQPAAKLETFKNYLAQTDDDQLSALRFTVHARLQRPLPGESTTSSAIQIAQSVCDEGHEFDYVVPANHYPTGSAHTKFQPSCGICTHRRVSPGINDLHSQALAYANQFDTLRNGGLTAHDVAANSKNKYWWLCGKGHSHEASPFKKTSGKHNCPICSNRVIASGINDLITTHPAIAAEWVHSFGHETPDNLSAGSDRLVAWLCPNEHQYLARVYERTTQKRGCPDCLKKQIKRTRTNLVNTHPGVASQWHPTLNGDHTAEHATFGSRLKVWWQCCVGHDYQQRIDKRTSGYGCSVCSRRTLVPGVNDMRTTEPVLTREFHSYKNGPKQPEELFASTTKFWWKCIANNHDHQQTVQHRRESRGCPNCPTEQRVLNTAA